MDDDIRKELYEMRIEMVSLRDDIKHIRELMINNTNYDKELKERVNDHGKALDTLFVDVAQIKTARESDTKSTKIMIAVAGIIMVAVQAAVGLIALLK